MNSADASTNEFLSEALRNRQARFFRASDGSAKGRSGAEDTARFAKNLMLLQECARLFGERLGMKATTSAALYEREETIGFTFDPSSDPQDAEAVGAIVNQRVPMRPFLESALSSDPL